MITDTIYSTWGQGAGHHPSLAAAGTLVDPPSASSASAAGSASPGYGACAFAVPEYLLQSSSGTAERSALRCPWTGSSPSSNGYLPCEALSGGIDGTTENRAVAVALDAIEQICRMAMQLLELSRRIGALLSPTGAPNAHPLSTAAAPQAGSTADNGPPPVGSTLDGAERRTFSPSGRFLWKPISERDGKLVVLLPKEASDAVRVEIVAPGSGEVLATGKATGIANGDRAHFRFGAGGGSYPDGAIVRATYPDGSTREVTVPETSARFTF